MKRWQVFLLLVASSAAHAGLTLLPGSSPQTVRSGEALLPITVRLTDDQGSPVKGASITYTVDPGGPFFPGPPPCVPNFGLSCAPTTDASGALTLPSLVANYPGHYLISITAKGYPPVAADITVTPLQASPVLSIIAGDSQTISIGMSGAPIAVRIMRDGQPVVGEQVRFTVGTGGGPVLFTGGVAITTVTTKSDGVATSPSWISTAGIGSGVIDIQTVFDNSGHDATARVSYAIVDSKGQTYYPYKPLWWGGPSQAGWGVAIPQHGEHVFPVYFTYDSANRPTWKAMQGQWVGGVGTGFRGDLYEYSGAPYFAFDTSKVRVIGSVPTFLAFNGETTRASLVLNANNGNVTPPPPTTLLPILPFSFAPATPRAELGVSDIWWGGPSQSGWGIHIAEDQGNLFLAWFTYDADGRNTWFAMPDGQWTDDRTWAGPVYRTSGSSRAGGAYDASVYAATRVGDFTIHFSGTMAATFTYNVDGHSGTLNLQRFEY